MANTYIRHRLRADPGLSLWVRATTFGGTLLYEHALPPKFNGSREYEWSTTQDLADAVNPASPNLVEVRVATDATTFDASQQTFGVREMFVRGGRTFDTAILALLDAAVSTAGGGGAVRNISIIQRDVNVVDN
jgi:hypothetical protein